MRSYLKSVICLVVLSTTSIYAQGTITTYEAESGVLAGGVYVSTAVSGYTGTGYVTNFTTTADAVTITVTAANTGKYKLYAHYRSQYGNKTQDLLVNGTFISNVIFNGATSFTTIQLTNIYLNQGSNTITIRDNWGYFDLDNIGLEPYVPNVYNIVANPVNPNVNAKTTALYNLLKSNFNSCTFTGQYSYWDSLLAITGKSPTIQGFDMQNYSPENPWCNGGTEFCGYDDGTVANAINWYNSTGGQGIVTFQWHWFSPSGGSLRTSTFNTVNTSFDVSKAVVTTNQEYTDAIRDIDAIAVQLQRLQTAGVPVLWRPLHEAGGDWFWWGAKGSAPALALYNIMYDRLTNYHQLNNLLWVWATPEASCYPGNNVVDIVGYDSYPDAYDYTDQKIIFDQLYGNVGGQKLIAMTENGSIPDIAQAFADDAPWSYFMSWNDLVYYDNTTAHIKDAYNQGCNLSSVVTGTSDNTLPTISNLIAYPNPFTNEVTVQIQNPQTQNMKLTITDSQGRQVFSSDNYATNQTIVLNQDLPIGVLYVQAIYGGKSSVYKLVKLAQ